MSERERSAALKQSEYRPNGWDLEQWGKGREKFAAFWGSLGQRDKDVIEYDTSSGLGELQALFLGLRAAIFENRIARGRENELIKNGLIAAGEIIYKPDIAKIIINGNRSVFGDGSDEEVMATLDTRPTSAEGQRKLGILLGFPRSSVEKFVEIDPYIKDITELTRGIYTLMRPGKEVLVGLVDKVRITGINPWSVEERFFAKDHAAIFKILRHERERLLKDLPSLQSLDLKKIMELLEKFFARKLVGAHGVTWVDYGGSAPDSVHAQQRLTSAFKESGILRVAKYFDDKEYV